MCRFVNYEVLYTLSCAGGCGYDLNLLCITNVTTKKVIFRIFGFHKSEVIKLDFEEIGVATEKYDKLVLEYIEEGGR